MHEKLIKLLSLFIGFIAAVVKTTVWRVVRMLRKEVIPDEDSESSGEFKMHIQQDSDSEEPEQSDDFIFE